MGVTEYPCPRCGQAQRVRAPNGSEVNTQRLCPRCEEETRNEKAGNEKAEHQDQDQEHRDQEAASSRTKAARR